MSKYTRLQFIYNSSKILAGASLVSVGISGFAKGQKVISPNDKISIGLIGCNGVGWVDLMAHLAIKEVECLALCDIDDGVLQSRLNEIEKRTGTRPTGYKDFRHLLDRKDINAVIIGTPDHWHALLTIFATEAGKDVYVEKPLANSIEECHAIAKAVKRYNRVVQVGLQQRSGEHWNNALDFVRSGKLGDIQNIKVWACSNTRNEVAVLPDQPVPTGIDYDMWLGPAPKRAFNQNRFHKNWRSYWDYGGGLMTDWGVHMIDMALSGMNATEPKSVVAQGGKLVFPNSPVETPDTLQAIFQFDKFNLAWEHTKGNSQGPFMEKIPGIAFYGRNGTLVATREQWSILPEEGSDKSGKVTSKMEAVSGKDHIGNDRNARNAHAKNFIECMKNRNQPVCDVIKGGHTTITAHLGNIAYRLDRKIFWDKEKQQFTGDKEANRMIKVKYREPWKLPNV